MFVSGVNPFLPAVLILLTYSVCIQLHFESQRKSFTDGESGVFTLKSVHLEFSIIVRDIDDQHLYNIRSIDQSRQYRRKQTHDVWWKSLWRYQWAGLIALLLVRYSLEQMINCYLIAFPDLYWSFRWDLNDQPLCSPSVFDVRLHSVSLIPRRTLENTKWLYNQMPPAWNFKIKYVKREETVMGSLEPSPSDSWPYSVCIRRPSAAGVFE